MTKPLKPFDITPNAAEIEFLLAEINRLKAQVNAPVERIAKPQTRAMPRGIKLTPLALRMIGSPTPG